MFLGVIIMFLGVIIMFLGVEILKLIYVRFLNLVRDKSTLGQASKWLSSKVMASSPAIPWG